LLIAGIATSNFGTSGALLACNEPGTPNHEMATARGQRAIGYVFQNTARVSPGSHPNGPLKVRVFFDIEMKERGTPDNQGWAYIENDGPHPLGYTEQMSYNIVSQQTGHINPANRQSRRLDQRLQVNKTYCMRVWSRTDGGCRSAAPSSWQCATVTP
jgi:hypothetical protein